MLCAQTQEDKLGFVLFKTIALDFFVAKIVAVSIGEAKRGYFRAKKQPASAAKSDFQTSTVVIQLLYVQAIAWLAIPYVPVVLLWCVFKLNCSVQTHQLTALHVCT